MPTVVIWWVWLCAFLNCAGWGLSAIHQLNGSGYAVVLLAGLAAWLCWLGKTGSSWPRFCGRGFCRRFRRPFPMAFLILAAMAFVGGLLYPPSNYDTLAYRLPRLLHWLAAGHWHWIHTNFARMNGHAAYGFEWISAPFIALLKTDRPLFLINLVSFLLLPGLIFSVFTRLGVCRRVAWNWMWIVPTGYCFLLQAGSLGDDLFGAPFALAAVDFALRARDSKSPRDFLTSMIAAALMTSAKISNLPLLLPWALALLPSLWPMARRPVTTAAVCLLAGFASVLPTVVLNTHYAGSWSAGDVHGSGIRALMLKVAVNPILLTAQNFVPPVFPLAEKWNRGVNSIVPHPLDADLNRVFDFGGKPFELPEMQIEENAGLGFGVCLLLLISVTAAWRFRDQEPPVHSCLQKWVRRAAWISLVAVVTQSWIGQPARTISSYYCLLIPALLVNPGHERLVRRPGWQRSAWVVFVLAALLLILSPARPLFPVMHLLGKMKNPPVRLQKVYTIYRARPVAFAPVLKALPRDVHVLGMITFDDPEATLWFPLGSRRIEHVCPQDSAADLKKSGIEYILVKEPVVETFFQCSFDDWRRKVNAQVVARIPLDLRASSGVRDWYLVKLQ
jgi:hypothetical protein